MNVIKVTIGKKVVLLRQPLIDDIEQATQIAGKVAGDNHAHLSVLLQKELLKKLVVNVDGKDLSKQDKMSLDKIFTVPEYLRLTKVIQSLTDDGMGNDMTSGVEHIEHDPKISGEPLPG